MADLGQIAEFRHTRDGGICNFRCRHLYHGLRFPESYVSYIYIIIHSTAMGEKKWYVLRAAGGKEKKAKEYLEKEIERYGLQDLVSQVLVPTEKVYKIRDGKRKSSERLFYPGYVLIEAELTGELQYIIRNEVPHMSGFLTEKREVNKGSGKSQEERIPVPLRDSEVKRILGEQDEVADSEGETIVDYAIGEAVKITDGPFSGFDGTVEEIVEDRSKLKVMVVIFGRKTLLELNFTQVTKE